jgi:hypothetical protein
MIDNPDTLDYLTRTRTGIAGTKEIPSSELPGSTDGCRALRMSAQTAAREQGHRATGFDPEESVTRTLALTSKVIEADTRATARSTGASFCGSGVLCTWKSCSHALQVGNRRRFIRFDRPVR